MSERRLPIPRSALSVKPAGSGKTLVAVLLIKDKSGSLRQDGKKKVSVFLAPKVVLVQQVSPVTSGVLVPLCPMWKESPDTSSVLVLLCPFSDRCPGVAAVPVQLQQVSLWDCGLWALKKQPT